MKILFFDGHCNLCNFFVDVLLRWDKNAVLKFAPLQGSTAQKILSPKDLSMALSQGDTSSWGETLIYRRGEGHLSLRSTAVLEALVDLGTWRSPIARTLLLLPSLLRDPIYRFISVSRLAIFGRRQSCRLPTPSEIQRFLE